MRHSSRVLFGLCIPLCSGACSPSTSTDAMDGNGRPVIFISIDSLRADHTTPLGYKPTYTTEDTTPWMARMASEGVLWENASSAAPWTLPSHISLMTGMSVLQHKVRTRGFRLADETEHIAGKFKHAGYRTAGFYSAPFLHPSWGYAQGFDTYVGAADYLNSKKTTQAITGMQGDLMQDVHHSADSDRETGEQVVDHALEWLATDGNAESPFFLFLHFWDPHYDYEPPAEYAERFHPGYEGSVNGRNFYSSDTVYDGEDLEHIKALYDAEIRYTDDHIARLWAKLEEIGIADEVILAVTSDHGDEFWEHDQKGHHKTLYEEVLHVPMVVRAPGLMPAGVRLTGSAPNYSLAPTLLDLAGLQGWPDRDGQSLRVQWEENDAPLPGIADLMHPGRSKFLHSWRKGQAKVLFSYQPEPMQLMVYDLLADPKELSPLFIQSDADSPFAAPAMDAFRMANQSGPPPAKMNESAAMTHQLEALGYGDSDPNRPSPPDGTQ